MTSGTKKRLNSYNGSSDYNSIYSDALTEAVNKWWQLSRLNNCSLLTRATGEKEVRLLTATMVCLGAWGFNKLKSSSSRVHQ